MRRGIVAIDHRDAARIPFALGGRTDVDIVSLTPSGRAELLKSNYRSISSSELYTSEHHRALALSWVERERALAAFASEMGLSPAETLVFLWKSFAATSCGLGLWKVFEGWQEIGLALDGGLEFMTPSAAHKMVCKQLFANENKLHCREVSLAAAVKTWVYNAIAGFLKPKILFGGRARGMDGLIAAARARDPRARIAFAAGGMKYRITARDIASLFLVPFRDTIYPIHCAFFLDRKDHESLRARISEFRGDEACENAMNAAASSIATAVLEAREWLSRLNALRGLAGVRSTVTWDSRAPKNAALTCFGLAAGRNAVIVPHASIAPGSAAAIDLQKHYANQLVACPTAGTVALVQSPLSNAAVASAQPLGARIPIPPFLWRTSSRQGKIEGAAASKTTRKKFLWGGNYQEWIAHQPFFQETSDEMIDGLSQLCKVFHLLPNFDLEIKIKPSWVVTHACRPQDLAALLPLRENIAITETTAFEDSLATACCVISFSSTVIEQSLHAQTPVILWGAGGRPPYIPEDFLAGQNSGRKVVFAPMSELDLRAAIEQVAETTDLPPSAASFDAFVWQDSENLDAAISTILKSG
jgi:hypothetical protein